MYKTKAIVFNFVSKNYSLCLILILGFILRLYTSFDFFLHPWDECYHALVSKNLLSDFLKPTLYQNPILDYNYTSWTSNHIWLHKQPMALFLIASSFELFGTNEIALRIPSVLTSTISIYFTYKIAKFFFNKNVALIAAFLFSVNGLIIELAAGRVATDHVDSIFLFFILLSILFVTEYSRTGKTQVIFWLGLSIGFAILTKWLTSLIVIPIWLLIAYNNNNLKVLIRHFILLVIVVSFVCLPWQFYIIYKYPLESSWEYSYNTRHFTEAIEGHCGGFLYYLNIMRINYGELVYIPLMWLIFKISIFKFTKNEFILFVWLIIPLIIFSIAKTKMPAYILFISPVLFMLFGSLYEELMKHSNKIYTKFGKLYIVLVLFLALRYCIERVKPFGVNERKPLWVMKLKELNLMKWDKSRVVIFNFPKPIDAMFYTGFTVYSEIPTQQLIDSLSKEGYKVLLNSLEGPERNLKGFESIKIDINN